jgi:ketosteroid isomerase-like protein
VRNADAAARAAGVHAAGLSAQNEDHTDGERRMAMSALKGNAVVGLLWMTTITTALAEGAVSSSPLSVTLPPALAQVLRDYEASWAARDAHGLAQLFAEDGFVLPNGGAPVRGRTAIEKHYTGHGGPLALRAFAFGVEGDVAYIIGGYAGEAGGPDDGKFTLTLKKGERDRWLIVSDMDSPNRRRD